MKDKLLILCWRITEILASRLATVIIWLTFEIYYAYRILIGSGNEPLADSAHYHPATTLTLFIVWTIGGVFLAAALWNTRKRKKK